MRIVQSVDDGGRRWHVPAPGWSATARGPAPRRPLGAGSVWLGAGPGWLGAGPASSALDLDGSALDRPARAGGGMGPVVLGYRSLWWRGVARRQGGGRG